MKFRARLDVLTPLACEGTMQPFDAFGIGASNEEREVKSALLLSGVLLLAQNAIAEEHMKHINPSSMPAPKGYSHAVEVGAGRTIYVSGQIPLDASGQLVGSGDIKAQTRQVFENLKSVLGAAGATLDDVVKITIFMKDISQVAGFREVRDTYFTQAPPASSLVEVKSLVRPELLLEMEAIAVVKDHSSAKK